MSYAVRLMIDEVAAVTGVPTEQILSEQRTAKVAQARAIAAYVVREVTLWSWTRVGRNFQKDHTTIIAAHRKIERTLSEDPALAALIGGLIERLRDAQRERFEGQIVDVIDLAGPIACGSLRPAIGMSARDIKRLAHGVMDLWDVALAAEVYVEHIRQTSAIQKAGDRRFAEALGLAITETVEAMRSSPEGALTKETV